MSGASVVIDLVAGTLRENRRNHGVFADFRQCAPITASATDCSMIQQRGR
jgi:hypothetical protein